MITRPLDLLSRLRKEPASYDWLHFVNAGLIALFFTLFGSRFVLSPGIAVEQSGAVRELTLPVLPQAVGTATATSLVISVAGQNLVFTDDGKYTFEEIRQWMKAQSKQRPNVRLLVRADASVALSDLAEIFDAAREAGFVSVQVAAEVPPESR